VPDVPVMMRLVAVPSAAVWSLTSTCALIDTNSSGLKGFVGAAGAAILVIVRSEALFSRSASASMPLDVMTRSFWLPVRTGEVWNQR
jgi:hypothetical protein